MCGLARSEGDGRLCGHQTLDPFEALFDVGDHLHVMLRVDTDLAWSSPSSSAWSIACATS
jgi:hypothetical protein